MENSNWKEGKSSELIDLISGFAFKSANFISEKKDNTLPIIKIKNVANGDVNLNDVVYHEYNEKFSNYVIEKGDILIAMTGNHIHAQTQIVGDVSLCKLDEPVLLNQRVGKFVAKENTDLKFAYYLFKDEETRFNLANKASGSANQANVSKTDILDLGVLIPPFPEQKAIASVLSSLDDKIDLLQQQNQTLEALAETLFRQWFIEKTKEDWEEESLSKNITFLNGLACQKFPPKNNIDKYPVLKIRELTSGITDNSDWATTEVKPEYIVKNGDVIFAWSASLMVKIWNGEDCVLNQHLFKVTSEEYPKWFYYFWCKQHLREFISIAQSHATTMGHIKRSDLDEAMVLVPDNDEIDRMTVQMNPILDKIQLNNNQINSLSKLRDTLLPKLMSGEVRVKN
ncbi:restriction endonuclease subunit S [Myroides odoratimimus]|uniref:restriction endonuclease subunit S n=1 Tax=Myroides TaxID=76831 RepID=UPI0009C03909|nr:restriction endonuclease subunit S [Myroides odoratimimus]MDM1036926.1 restriction endonuclease subunit S [Myroides odoratimimus]MDM1053431.1 restriction endonuclease subunit S [Myroides odoratimimus]MDM1085996.1 restriction endonuclease subunit S [Myroides odoratimimus]